MTSSIRINSESIGEMIDMVLESTQGGFSSSISKSRIVEGLDFLISNGYDPQNPVSVEVSGEEFLILGLGEDGSLPIPQEEIDQLRSGLLNAFKPYQKEFRTTVIARDENGGLIKETILSDNPHQIKLPNFSEENQISSDSLLPEFRDPSSPINTARGSSPLESASSPVRSITASSSPATPKISSSPLRLQDQTSNAADRARDMLLVDRLVSNFAEQLNEGNLEGEARLDRVLEIYRSKLQEHPVKQMPYSHKRLTTIGFDIAFVDFIVKNVLDEIREQGAIDEELHSHC